VAARVAHSIHLIDCSPALPIPPCVSAQVEQADGGLEAPAKAAEEDRELVADELATTAGEDRGQAGQARAVLLADAG